MNEASSVPVRQALRSSELLLAKAPREVGGAQLSLVEQYRVFLDAGRRGQQHGRFLANAAGTLGQLGARLPQAGVEHIFGAAAAPLALGIAVAASSLEYVARDSVRFTGSLTLPPWMFHEAAPLPDWTVLYAPRAVEAGRVRAVAVRTDQLMCDVVIVDTPTPYSFDVQSPLIIETRLQPQRGGGTFSLPLPVFLAPEILGYTMASGLRLLDELDHAISCSAELLGSFRSPRSDARRVLSHRRDALDSIDDEIVDMLQSVDRHAHDASTSRLQRQAAKHTIGRLRHRIVATVVGDLPASSQDTSSSGQRPVRTLQTLTSREWEILSQLTTRATLHEIAARLFISPNTLKTHLKSLYRKIGVTSRREAADLAEHSLAS
jgi:DNA-binding NarL/FixJ family response regulator